MRDRWQRSKTAAMSSRRRAKRHDVAGESARSAPGAQRLVDAMSSPSTYPGHPSVVVHETHASWVFVAAERAYKIKKPVSLGFLDYSTLDRRHAACREEVRVNQPLAADLYVGVRAIVPLGEGGVRLVREDASGAIEHAVEMRTFNETETFASLIDAGSLTRDRLAAAARVLADFHRAAPRVPGWGAGAVAEMWRANVEQLQALACAPWHAEVASQFGRLFARAHAPEIETRASAGRARDGHGDLRCEHVLAGPPLRIVDRIEFDPELRRMDGACDLAFLAMDLEASGEREAAETLWRCYEDAGMPPASRALRSFYAAHWALVRAKVTLIRARERIGNEPDADITAAERLWRLAGRLCWRARGPLAIVICGPAASGKSLLASELARESQLAVLASDTTRKRLAGLAPTQRARQEHYSEGLTRRTYGALARDARHVLDRGEGVIVDATCKSESVRAPMLEQLRRSGAPVLIVRCEVPLRVAVARAQERMCEPGRVSDATPAIVARQFAEFDDFDDSAAAPLLALDATRELHEQTAEVASAFDRFVLGAVARGESPAQVMRAR
jgi:aminoglycoside phosphotransferase family enzyme/predicted kinase